MYRDRDMAERLKGFGSVWKRVEESKGHTQPALPTKRKPQRKSCAVRFCPGRR